MANFNFTSGSNSTFNFGFTGDFSNFNFTEISSGETSYDFEFGEGTSIFYILLGSSNIFNSIWADPTASLTNGKFYIGRNEDLHIISAQDGQVSIDDYFSNTVAGSTNETLKADNVVDINVTY